MTTYEEPFHKMLCEGFSQIISSMIIRTSGFCLLKVGTPLCVFTLILANAYALDKMRKHRRKLWLPDFTFGFLLSFWLVKRLEFLLQTLAGAVTV